jgi:hypothetical protein
MHRERWIAITIALSIVGVRAAIFLLRPETYFDSDQAIVGLMAKHLAELRAFPVFLYGQTYMLGVEAWLAAPLFAIAGASATALKVPLLAMNGVIAVLLMRAFERDMGLRPMLALVASLPFLLPSVGLAAVFMDSSGGSLEPLLYVVLLWATRDRPLLCGVVFGIGFLNREFTLYGLVALAALAWLDGRLFTADGARRFGRIVAVAAAIFLAVQGLKYASSASGPGTTVADTFTTSNNLAELAARTCISPAKAIGGAGRLFSIHWPAILGTAPYPLTAFSIESRVAQGMTGTSLVPALLVLLSIAGLMTNRRASPERAQRPRFAQYLVLVGLLSIAGYLVGRCGEVSFLVMRYELLSVLGIAGLLGWFLWTRPTRAGLAAWSVVLAAWMAIVSVPHVRFIAESFTDPVTSAKRELIQALDASGIRYGKADYWLAYYIDFVTNERMIFASTSPQRILLYNRIVEEHAREAVRLSRRACDGGVQLVAGVYRCP